MNTIVVRDATEADFERIVALNAMWVQETSPMDIVRLRHLHGFAFHHRIALVDGQVAAFLLAMRDGTAYLNDNYGWFSAQYPHFVYVDRIVVDATVSGRGIGRLLYEDLFARSRASDIGMIACEYNIEPPNPASKAFHDRFGFVEVGTHHVAGGSKRVSLQIAYIMEHTAA